MAEFIHTINTSASDTGHAAVKITITVSGANNAQGTTIDRTGRCLSELGRALKRISKKYDISTRSTR